MSLKCGLTSELSIVLHGQRPAAGAVDAVGVESGGRGALASGPGFDAHVVDRI